MFPSALRSGGDPGELELNTALRELKFESLQSASDWISFLMFLKTVFNDIEVGSFRNA